MIFKLMNYWHVSLLRLGFDYCMNEYCGYYINGYCGYYINAYCGYFINGYWWLLYYKLLLINLCYINI